LEIELSFLFVPISTLTAPLIQGQQDSYVPLPNLLNTKKAADYSTALQYFQNRSILGTSFPSIPFAKSSPN
jgi:hypothetical protein